MAEKKIKGEILEAKIYPCCENCEFLAVDTIGFLRKKFVFGCSAQGFQASAKVYGSENCIGNYVNQLGLPILETGEGK